MGDIDHRLNVAANVVPVSTEDLGDIDDHVEFLTAVGQCPLCFRLFDGDRVTAMREANGC